MGFCLLSIRNTVHQSRQRLPACYRHYVVFQQSFHYSYNIVKGIQKALNEMFFELEMGIICMPCNDNP